jgi:hypothetical protein
MFLCGEEIDALLLDWVDGEGSSENGLDLGLGERNTDFEVIFCLFVTYLQVYQVCGMIPWER